MSCEYVFEVGECVTGHAKRSRLDVVWKRVKSSPEVSEEEGLAIWGRALFRVEQDLCELLVSNHVTEDHARVERRLFIRVSSKRRKDDLLVSCTDVFDGG